MTSPTTPAPWLLMGANGRVGGLLSRAWALDPPPHPVATQARRAGHDLTWSPLEDGPAPLVDFARNSGGLGAIIALVGATPSTTGALADHAPLACAILDAAQAAGVPRVLLASSAAVYGAGQDMAETTPPAPTSPYGQAKCDMEQAVRARAGDGVESCCLRIGNVAGADALLGVAARGDGPVLLDRFADGQGPLRSYIAPSQLARSIAALLTSAAPMPDILNMGAPKPVAMQHLCEAAGLAWHWVPAPEDRAPTQRITLDCARLAAIVGDGVLDPSAAAIVADLRKLGALR